MTGLPELPPYPRQERNGAVPYRGLVRGVLLSLGKAGTAPLTLAAVGGLTSMRRLQGYACRALFVVALSLCAVLAGAERTLQHFAGVHPSFEMLFVY